MKIISATRSGSSNTVLKEYDFILFYIKENLIKNQIYMIKWHGFITFNPYGIYYSLDIVIDNDEDYGVINSFYKNALKQLEKTFI